MHTQKFDRRFDHIGIPTSTPRANERYSSTFKMYTSEDESSDFHIQYHRFEPGSSLHPLIQTLPHMAYRVDSIDAEISGKTCLLGPYFPFEGYRVAMILENGMLIELIETQLTEAEIWKSPKTKSYIYPEDNLPAN